MCTIYDWNFFCTSSRGGGLGPLGPPLATPMRMAQNGHHILLNYCRIGARRPTTSVCKSQRSNQKQMEGSQHWGSSKIHCTMEKRLIAVRKQNGGAIQHISANRCDWILISCSETCCTYWLFCTFRTPAQYTLLRISLLKQKGISSWFLILFSYDCYFFCLNSIEQYNISAKLGTFFMIHPVRSKLNKLYTYTQMDSRTRTACWPTAVMAGLRPACWLTASAVRAYVGTGWTERYWQSENNGFPGGGGA